MPVFTKSNSAVEKRLVAQGDKFRLASSYLGVRKPLALKCTRCGTVRLHSLGMNALKSRLKCTCEHEKAGKPFATKKQWQAKIDERHGRGEYRLLKRHGNYEFDARHACGIVSRFKVTSLVRRGKYVSCPCSHKKLVRHDAQTFGEQVSKRGFECLAIDTSAKTATYRHSCGFEFDKSGSAFKYVRRCPSCEEPMQNEDDLQARIDAKFGEREYVVIQRSAKIVRGHRSGRIEVRHRCGHAYWADMRALYQFGSSRCPECFGRAYGAAKEIELGGTTFRCQGHEPFLLKKLVVLYDPSEIVTSLDKKRLRIQYRYGGKRLNYYPDFWIPSRNKIFEVKSTATLGLVRDSDEGFFGEDLLAKNQAKARACIKRGYSFKLVVYGSKGNRLKVPPGWIRMDKKELAVAMQLNKIAAGIHE
jgi:NAD-dependent SIR2 family protein deacetylase